MSTDNVWIAMLAAAPATIGAFASEAFQVPVGDYMIAIGLSVIGIVARHSLDAAKPNGIFNLRLFGIDLLTAPMLGISGYMVCIYMEIAPLIAPGVVIGLSFLGPEAVRAIYAAFVDLITGRIRGGGKP